jgi:AcrR family transcriptional regulator
VFYTNSVRVKVEFLPVSVDHVAALPPPPRRGGRANPVARRATRRLSREAILDAALQIVDAEGLDALTMRRVSDALETGPASLYAHIGDKDEMIEALLDRVSREVPLPQQADPDRWEEQLKEIARSARAVYARHRDLARAGLGIVPTGEHSLPVIETMLAILSAGGVSPRVAALSLDILGLYITATAVEESIEARTSAGGPDDPYYTELREYWSALPADRFPHLSAMAVALTSGDGDDRFDFGLDILIRGIASTVSD